MAAGIEPPSQFLITGWLLVSGEKMSKSGGNQVTPAELVEEYGLDAFRYHLLRDVPLGSDGDFSYEGITARYNADLANNLGNLMARVSTVVGSKCGGVGPAADPASPLAALAADVVSETMAGWTRAQPHAALEATWRLIHETNAHLETTEPWKAEPGPAVDAVLGSALEALRIVALLIGPAMPDTSIEIWRRLGLDGQPAGCRVPDDTRWGGYPGGLTVEKGSPLFPRRKE
jgi:methionyl-tRNA synthetase